MANPFESVWNFAKDTWDGVFGSGSQPAKAAAPIQATQRPIAPKSFDLSLINPAYRAPEYEGQKPLWLTGGDPDAAVNSWRSDFIERMFQQRMELEESGDIASQFQRKDATGVVTWDHVGEDNTEFRFGDVYDNGKFLGNLYEDQEDTGLADLMMSQITLDSNVIAHLSQGRDVAGALRTEMEKIREQNTKMMADAATQAEFDKEVSATQSTITDWFGGRGDGIVSAALGAAGGAAGGFTAGSLFGGVGAIPGTIIGGVAGGVSAYLNRDDVSREMAAAFEVAKKAFEDDQTNLLGASGTAAVQASGLAVRSISPLSNLVRGIADPERGNGVGAFMEEDRPSWARPLDIGVGVADAAFQFGLAAPRAIYMAQMSGHAWGRATELTVGAGVQWDPVSGRMKSVYRDEETGEYTPGRGMAAWGTAGIDFLQVGFARGLRSQIRGGDTSKVTDFDRAWLRGDAKAAAVRAEDIGPQRFFFDANDKVVGRRLKQTAFVPSEGTVYLAATGAGRKAFNQAVGRMPKTVEARMIKEGKQPYALGEDLNHYMYQAAQALSYQHNPFKAALVNGFGNGTEAATQAALEQLSFGHRPTLQDIAIAYGYGTAMGLGMTVGTNINLVHQDSAQYELAKEGFRRLHGRELTQEEYNQLSRAEKRDYARESFDKEAQAQWDQLAKDNEKFGLPVEGMNELSTKLFEDMIQAELDAELEKAGIQGEQNARLKGASIHPVQVRKADGSPRIEEMAHSDDVRAYTPDQIANYLKAELDAFEDNIAFLQKRAEQYQIQLDQAPDDGKEPFAEKLADAQAKIELHTQVNEARKIVADAVNQFLERLYALEKNDTAAKRQIVAQLNQFLEDAWRGRPIVNRRTGETYHEGGVALRMAASMARLRSPLSSAASVSIYGMAVDWAAVKGDILKGYVLEPLTGLEKIEADFDGDRSASNLNLLLSEQTFTQLANGLNLVNTQGGRTRWQVATMEHDVAAFQKLYHTLKGDFGLVKPEAGLQALKGFVETLRARYNFSADIQVQLNSTIMELFEGQRNDFADLVDNGMNLLSTALLSIPEVNSIIHNAAETRNSNEPETVLAIFRAHMEAFVRHLDATMLYKNADAKERARQINLSQKVPHGTQVGAVSLETTFSAATALESVLWMSGSDSLLRTGQALKYEPTFYNDVVSREVDKDQAVHRLASSMRELATESLNDGIDQVPDTFDVSGRVLRMARQMVNTGHIEHGDDIDQAVFRLLTGKTEGFTRDESGNAVRTHKQVSVAQVLVLEVISSIRRSAGHILQRNPELARRIDFLERAGRDVYSDKGSRSEGEMMLLLEAIGGLSMTDIAGVDVVAETGLLPNGTINQHLNRLWTMPLADRKTLIKQMKDPSWAGGNELLGQMRDILVEAANKKFNRDEAGNPTGLLAESNTKASKLFQSGLKNLQEAVEAFRVRTGLTKEMLTSYRALEDFLLTHDVKAREFLQSLLSQTGVAAFTRDANGQPVLREAFIDALMEKDTQKAEMKLWRVRIDAGLRKFESEKADNPKKEPQDTGVALMYYLKHEADPTVREEILQEYLREDQTREGFERYMGAQPHFYFTPVMMYENIVETFQATQPQGGWGSPAMSLRQEISQHGNWLNSLPKQEIETDQIIAGTVKTAAALETEFARVMENGGQDTPRMLAFKQMVDNNFGRNLVATDAGTAIAAITDTLSDVTTKMHVKGDVMKSLEGLAKAPWLNSLLSGHTDPGSEAVEVLLKTVDLQDVRERPELMLHAEEVRDETGALVEDLTDLRMSDGITPDYIGILRKFQNPKLAMLMTEMILPKSISYDASTGVERTGYLGPNTLEKAINDPWVKAFEIDPSTKTYSREADLVYGTLISAEVQRRNPDEINAFTKEVANLVVARMTAGEGRVLTKEEINHITVQAWRDTAQAYRNMALYVSSHGEVVPAKPETENSPAEPAHSAKPEVLADTIREAKNRQREDAASQYAERMDTFGRLRKEITSLESAHNKELLELIQARAESVTIKQAQEHVERLVNLYPRIEKDPNNPELKAEYAELMRDIRNSGVDVSTVNMFSALTNNDVVQFYKAWYYVDPASHNTTTHKQKEAVSTYIKNNKRMLDRIKDDRRDIVVDFLNGHREPRPEEWEALSQMVILDRLDRESILPSSSLRGLPSWPADERLLDPTYAEMLDPFGDVESPLMQASLDLVKMSGLDKMQVPTREQTVNSLTRLYHSSKVPLWASHVPAMGSAISSALSSPTIKVAPTMAGDSSKNYHALSTASSRTYRVPPEEFMIDVKLVRTRSDGLRIQDSPIPMDVLDLEGAFLQIFDANGNEIVFNGINPKIPGTAQPLQVQAANTDLLTALIKKHGNQLTVRMFHPAMRPEGADWLNNIYFDGVIAHNSMHTPGYDSIIAEGVMGTNGINVRSQRRVLDAVKRRINAIHTVRSSARVDAGSADAIHTYMASLANEYIYLDLGHGKDADAYLGAAYYKYALKLFYMRHIVVYADGTKVPVSTHMSRLAQDPNNPELAGAKLQVLTRRQANTLYGEIGNKGLTMGFPQREGLSTEGYVFSFDNLTPRAQAMLDNLDSTVKLEDTRLAQGRTPLSSIHTNTRVQLESASEHFTEYMRLVERRAANMSRRRKYIIDRGMNVGAIRSHIADKTRTLLENDRAVAANLTFMGHHDAAVDLDSFDATDPNASMGSSMFNIFYSDLSDSDYHLGEVNRNNFHAYEQEIGPSLGETMTIDLAGIKYPEEAVANTRKAAAAGMNILFVGKDVQNIRSRIISEISGTHESRSDAPHIWSPSAALAGFRHEQAALRQSQAAQQMTSTARMWSFNIYPGQAGVYGLEENMSYVLDGGQSIALGTNVVRHNSSSLLTPVRETAADIRNIRDMLNNKRIWKKARKAVKQSRVDTLTLEEARQDLLDRLDMSQLDITTVGTELKPGMFTVHHVHVPRADYGTRKVYYLHRVGSEWVSDAALAEAVASGQNLVIGPEKLNDKETVVPGVVVGHGEPMSNLQRIYVETTMQEAANKTITGAGEGGMKFIHKEIPDHLRDIIPPLFRYEADGGLVESGRLNLLSLITDNQKKQNFEHMAVNYREAAAILGFDNMLIFYEGAYGEKLPADPAARTAEQVAKYEALETLMETVAKQPTISSMTAENLIATLSSEAGILATLPGINLAELAIESTALRSRMEKLESEGADTAASRILLAALIHLSAPGGNFAEIKGARGFMEHGDAAHGAATHRMPARFTQVFAEGAMRELALEMFNQRLLREGPGGGSWFLDNNYDLVLETTGIDGKPLVIRGVLSRPVHVNVGEQAALPWKPDAKKGVSTHDNRMLEAAVGTPHADAFNASQFENRMEAQLMGQLNFNTKLAIPESEVPEVSKLPRIWHKRGLLDRTYMALAREDIVRHMQPLDLSAHGDSKAKIERLEAKIQKQAERLFGSKNIESKIHYMHWLLRMRMGRPVAKDKASESEISAANPTLKQIETALKATKEALDAGRSPLYRGAVPLVTYELANAIYIGQQGKDHPWQPKVWTEKRSGLQRAESINDYILAFFNDALGDYGAVHIQELQRAMDGAYHTYLDSVPNLRGNPVSLDVMSDLLLLSENNRFETQLKAAIDSGMVFSQYVQDNPGAVPISLSRYMDLQLSSDALHDSPAYTTMARVLGTDVMEGLLNPQPATAEQRAEIERRWNNFRKENDIPYPTEMSPAVARDSVNTRQDRLGKANIFVRSLMALRAALSMNQPPLMVAALVEASWKRSIHGSRKMLTGESTSLLAVHANNIVENILEKQAEAEARGETNYLGTLVRGIGYMPMYTSEQAALKNKIVKTSAASKELQSMIMEDLNAYHDELSSAGVPAWLIKATKFGGAWQDMGRGTRATTLTTSYVDAFLSYAVNQQGMSLDMLLAHLAERPAETARTFPQAHNAAIQAMNDIRATQKTVLSKMIRGVYQPMTTSGNAGINAFGNLFFAMPLMFSNYAANFLLTATGLRGIDMLAAHALQGRQKPGSFFHQLSAKVRGEEVDIKQSDLMDMDDVIGSLDAMDAVINMGVTHSQLFLAGLIMQGLGLSGEDEETKRRRRLERLQGAGHLYDPRKLENDFRNKDVMFLDWLPGPLAQLFATVDAEGNKRSYAQLHWTMQQVFLPMMGMEKFFETGDIRHVWWGFTDAIGSMPLVNTMMLDRGLDMAAELTAAAADADAVGGTEGLTDTMGFLGMLVSTFENMLFESAFLNQLYVGLDDYDRDPYVLPLRDSDGTLQRDAFGEVRPNKSLRMRSEGLDGRGLALETFFDEDGQMQQGYAKLSAAEAQSRSMAKNRLSYAIVSSLFTGLSGKGSNLRYNMPIKQRTFEKPELSEAQQKAIVLGGVASNEEFMAHLTKALKKSSPMEEQQAAALALSILDEEGDEILSDEGAMAIYRGIVGGTTQFGSESLQGIYIDFETRQRIASEWMAEMTQKAVNAGLSEAAAKRLAKQAFYGPQDGSGTPGFSDILWSTQIPYTKTQRYAQLNTTYVMGPDGNPWATGFTRTKLLGALGLTPLLRPYNSADTRLMHDARGNTLDPLLGINTGHRALERMDDSRYTPTDAEIGDAITKAIEDLDLKSFTPGSGYRRGGRGGGGGGGGIRPQYRRAQTPYWNDIRARASIVNSGGLGDVRVGKTPNATLRRSTVKRQRISSERGRLKEWQ